jgi:hypothetical protein
MHQMQLYLLLCWWIQEQGNIRKIVWSIDELFFKATNTILTDPSKDDMNFYVVHVICDDCSILPSKENQISFWVNCNHCVVINTMHETKFNINPSK